MKWRQRRREKLYSVKFSLISNLVMGGWDFYVLIFSTLALVSRNKDFSLFKLTPLMLSFPLGRGREEKNIAKLSRRRRHHHHSIALRNKFCMFICAPPRVEGGDGSSACIFKAFCTHFNIYTCHVEGGIFLVELSIN